MIVYLAGPMTGWANGNKESFHKKAKELHEQGHIVWNPAHNPDGMGHDEYLHVCEAMIDICDAVYFLYGWSQSKGARREFNYACQKGKQLMFEETNLDVSCFKN